MSKFVTNRMKKLLQGKKLTLGTWITLTDSDVTDALARVGFDWFVIDTEHAPLTVDRVQKLVQPLSGTEVSPLVRVAWNDPVMIKLALDTGVEGVVIPWVNSKEDAIRAVKACKYPPEGIRGFGPRRAGVYGFDQSYAKEANGRVCVIVQIETAEAVKNAKEILSVNGIDAFFIGPYDLSWSLGVPGEFESEKFKSAIDTVLKTGREADKVGGVWTDDPKTAVRRIKQGFRFIALSSELAILIKSAREWISIVKRDAQI